LFFALLGGIAMWGLLGVVMGPIIAAAFMILLKVFEMRLHPEDDITPEIPAAEET
jgi:predicted PurR-regulated permease PerM